MASQSDRYELVCIGCGPAGEKAATQAAYFGRRVAVIEREQRPGGAMVNTGTIPSKALRETAILCSSFRRRPIPGINLQLDSGLSIQRFMAQRHLIQQEEHDRIEASFDGHGIDVIPGSGRIIDAHTIAIDRYSHTPCRSGCASGSCGEPRIIHADHILIATGSRPFRPAQVPFHHPGVVDADGILELDRMPRRMLIVGGGVIGSEYACIFAEIGTSVTLIEPRDCILPFIDSECRSVLERAMRSADIDLRTNIGIAAFHADDHAAPVEIALDNGAAESFDTVLWAAGRTGNTDGLGLENVSIAPDKRGYLSVNEHYQTATPSIYAAGDVIGFPALTSTSMEQGRVAACHMFNIEFKQQIASVYPIGLYTIPPVASVGVIEDEAREKGRDVVIGRAHYRMNARGRMYRDNEGLVKLVFDRATRTLLGATIVGEQATELIHIAHVVMAAGMGIDYFINACFNYPSISDLYKYATYDALQRLQEKRPARGKAA